MTTKDSPCDRQLAIRFVKPGYWSSARSDTAFRGFLPPDVSRYRRLLDRPIGGSFSAGLRGRTRCGSPHTVVCPRHVRHGQQCLRDHGAIPKRSQSQACGGRRPNRPLPSQAGPGPLTRGSHGKLSRWPHPPVVAEVATKPPARFGPSPDASCRLALRPARATRRQHNPHAWFASSRRVANLPVGAGRGETRRTAPMRSERPSKPANPSRGGRLYSRPV